MSVAVTRYAGTVVNQTGIGGIAWGSPGNAAGSNLSTYSLFQGSASSTLSNWLWATNFGFDAGADPVPATATIDGVEYEFYRSADDTTLHDNSLKLIVDGAVSGTDKAATTTYYPATAAWSSKYGGPTDKWGNSLTAALVRANNYGAALSAYAPKNDTARVFAVRMTVYYTGATLFLPAWYVQQRRNRR